MLPIRSESGPEVPARSPVANYLLTGLVVLLSLLFFGPLDAHHDRIVDRIGDDVTAVLRGEKDVAAEVGQIPGALGHFVLQHGDRLRPTQLVGVAFVHGNALHLLGNVLLLLIFGGPVCRAIGGWRFLGLWVGCAVVASLGWLALGSGGYAVGASGVVMALGGACLVVLPETKVWVLCHPLSWIGGAVFLGALALLGNTWALALLALVVVAWVAVNLRIWADEREGPPEGIVSRVLGFVVFRPRVVWLMAFFLLGDLFGFVVSHGDGPLAQILRLAGDDVAHEAHLAGALGGLLGGWLLVSANAVERVAVARPAPATRRLSPLAAGLPAARPVLWVDSGCAPAPVEKVSDFEGWRAQREATPRAGVTLTRPAAVKADPKVGTRSVRRPPPPPLPTRRYPVEDGLLEESPV